MPLTAEEIGQLRKETPLRVSDIPHRQQPFARSLKTVYTWITRGLYGCRLRAYLEGGRWMTSEEELCRFYALVTETRLSGMTSAQARELGPASLARRAEKASHRLREMLSEPRVSAK